MEINYKLEHLWDFSAKSTARKLSVGGVLNHRLCPTCGKKDCPGCGPLAMPTKKTAPKNIKDRFDVTKAKSSSVIDQLPKKLLYTTEDGIKVFEVDDDFVKINLYDDFTEGGNWEAYPEFVPKGEIWVAMDKTPENKQDIITHELTEVRLMQNKGLKYEQAHKIANKIEMNERIHERPGLLVTKHKKGGKIVKKAMEGALLGLGGMGQLQDKAPQPTNRNAAPDKVKQNFALYKRKTKKPKPAYGH